MMKRKPAAFMSYVHSDDEHDNRRLTQFCERLSAEVCVQTGKEFPIFQDRKDIQWGQNWKERIEKSLDEIMFLIPIITPSFFNSQDCLDELQQFLEREKELGRNDLILPVYYVDCPLLNDEAKRATDELAQVIAARQYTDWRDLRFEPFTSSQIRRELARLAIQIRDALERVSGSGRDEAPDTARRPAREPSISQGDIADYVMRMKEIGETTRLPFTKTEPPTRVVDPMHRGDHTTITEAIEAANPGDRILVRPGLYQEGVIIDKPLEIIGEGESGEIVIEAQGKNALLFKTTMGRVVNLTLRQVTGRDGNREWDCVDITQGRLELEGCDISSQSEICIIIRGGADPRLRHNRIHDNKEVGVVITGGSQGTLEHNDIFDNGHAGVMVGVGSNPTFRDNRIYGNERGVFVFNNGRGILESNDIFNNTEVGILIWGGSNPILHSNRIHDSKENGVTIGGNSQGTLEDNDIFGNDHVGVLIVKGSNPILRHNRIHDSEQDGVLVYENGQGILEDNDIFANTTGVAIKTGGNPTLRHNRIHNSKQDGVLVYENGQGILEDNDIFDNILSGVVIKTGGDPTLRRNRIHSGRQAGVLVYKNGQGTLEGNDIFSNTDDTRLVIETDGNPTLKYNRLHTQSLDSSQPKGVAGKQLLHFAGAIDADDLQMMTDVIEAGCEQVDLDEW
ncbi:MAG: right-handed parallel beta-helix repeat-containing protein [Candidatus Binatia bacterium]